MDRFWTRVEKKADGGWLWTGHLNQGGYGDVRFQGRMQKAHRVSYQLATGPIPEGLFVLHKCDVRNCVRPDHLWLGTLAENNTDMDAKGRRTILRGEDHGRYGDGRPGSQNSFSKLTEEAARAIRAQYGRLNQYELADKFNISQTTVNRILNRKAWTHV